MSTTDAETADKRREALRRLLDLRGLAVGAETEISARPEDAAAPLSATQRQLWLFEQMFPGTGAYNVPAAVRLSGELDVWALQRAINAAMSRHGVLRASFGLSGAEPEQRIAAHPAVCEIQRHDMTHVPARQRERVTKEMAGRFAAHPFDLAGGPLMRADLILLAPDDHLLVLTMHHLVGDAWSWSVLLSEVVAGYSAVRQGGDPPADPLSIHYGDFARWQRQRVDSGALDRQLSYWRDRLAEPPPWLPLPSDRPRPLLPRFRGAVVDVVLDEQLVAGLRHLAEKEGTTLFTVVLTVFEALLYRYTGATEFVVATSVANREHPQVRQMVGLFVNTMLIRAAVDGRVSFRDLVRRVRQATSGALANQDVPFETVVERLRPGRGANSTPYFNVMCTMRAAPTFPEMAGVQMSDFPVHNGTSKRDLTLNLVEDGARIQGHVEFDTALFDRETAAGLVRHLRRLAASAVASPDVPVGSLVMLTDDDVTRALAGPVIDWPAAASCVHELVAEQAARTPHRVAVEVDGTRLTFAELDQLASQLAHLLQEAGIGPEKRVGLCLDRSVELIVAILGVLKAGGAYVPVDPGDPVPRWTTILRDAGVGVLIRAPTDDPAPPSQLPQVHVIELELSWKALRGLPTHRPTSAVGPANAAYVLYTSGSTGAPKGVVVEHRQIVSYTLAILDRLGIAEPLSYAMIQPLTVDSSLTMLLPPLITGGCLHVMTRARSLDADALADYMVDHRIDCLKIAPSHLKALLRTGRGADLLPRRHLIVGGEASDWAWLSAIERFGRCRVYNHYGPTEATVGVTIFPVTDRPPSPVGVAPLGFPLANCRAQILDRDGQPVPVGVPGELYLAGDNIARGYLDRADLTAAAFVPGQSGVRLYRTGDRVRLRRDGALAFLGRGDDQVKVRGFRVELGEIESVLIDCPLVREALVLVRREEPTGAQIVGYVVGTGDTDAVLAYLRERLPAHMVPSALVPLNALPLSAHGKVSRDALPAPTRSAQAVTAPRDEGERAVAEIWRDLLGLDDVGIDQNFFDIGGDSLLLMSLHQRLRLGLGLDVDLVELFRATTIRAQAALRGAAIGATELTEAKQRGRRQAQHLRRRQADRGDRRM